MAAIYQWYTGHEIVVTTTPYPVEVVESLVFGITLSTGHMDLLPFTDVGANLGVGPDGSLTQIRWFYTDGPYNDEVTAEFGIGPDGTLIQLRWFYEDGPYDDEVVANFEAMGGTLIEIPIVEADTPDESLQLGITINDTSTMDLI